jgi:hypothetical protein
MEDSSSRAQGLGYSLSDRLFCPRLLTTAIQRSVPLGGKPGGKIVKQRTRGVVAASGHPRLVGRSHLAGLVVASTSGAET